MPDDILPKSAKQASQTSRKTTLKNEALEESESLVVFREYDRRSSKKPKLIRGNSELEEEKTVKALNNVSNFDENANVGDEGCLPKMGTLKSQVQKSQPSANRHKFRS